MLDLTDVPASMNELYLWAFDKEENLVLRDTISAIYFGEMYELEIKRAVVDYYLWGNVGNATKVINEDDVNAQLSVIQNNYADSLYSYSNELDASGEFAIDTVSMYKEFANVEVIIKNSQDNISLEFLGNSCGYYVNSTILQGGYSVTCSDFIRDIYNNYLYLFRVTRQQELEKVELALYKGSGNGKMLLNRFPIGKWLIGQGYNMFEQNMPDISIEIDYSNNNVTISTTDWSFTKPSDVEI